MAEGFITRKSGGSNKSNIPEYAYSGESFIFPVGKKSENVPMPEEALWLTSSGVLNFTKNVYADVYLIGGGGGGGTGGTTTGGGGGGGGGYTYLKNNVFIPANCNFLINIGKGGSVSYNVRCQGGYGEATTAFGFFANGGYGGGSTGPTANYAISGERKGGDGGSGGGTGTASNNLIGGKGGYGGQNGYAPSTLANVPIQTLTGGLGQGEGATYLFNNKDNFMVAYGGAGGTGDSTPTSTASNFITDYYPHNLTNRMFGSGGQAGIYANNARGLKFLTEQDGQDGAVIIKFKSRHNYPASIPSFKYYSINAEDNNTEYNEPYVISANSENDWQLKFLSNGIFSPMSSMTIDAFLVGGGGGGAARIGGGGAGGFTTTGMHIPLLANELYYVNIGQGGESFQTRPTKTDIFQNLSGAVQATAGNTTTAFNLSALGGGGGVTYNNAFGGIGGSGGGKTAYNGGSDGQNMESSSIISGMGQGYTTRAFKELDGELYAGGGGGGSTFSNKYSIFGRDGFGGGGRGGFAPYAGTNGIDGYGGGGGGGGYDTVGGRGGNGTVIIRPTKLIEPLDNFISLDENNNNYYYKNSDTIAYTNNSAFTVDGKQLVDIFLVGGGGGSGSIASSGGGGGGFTSTINKVMLYPNIDYTLTIGSGGDIDQNGGVTTFSAYTNSDTEVTELWSYTVSGGFAPTATTGAAGGSGGGDAANSTNTYPGCGGVDGANGYQKSSITVSSTTGFGQNRSTRAFGDINGELYASGGAGGSNKDRLGLGGLGGGGITLRPNGADNMGGGGAGKTLNSSGGKGGSGVVLLRKYDNVEWFDADEENIIFKIGQIKEIEEPLGEGSITKNQLIEDASVWGYTERGDLKILLDCYLQCIRDSEIDIFLAGGGGAGGQGTSTNTCGAGGGGGYSKSIYKIPVLKNKIYKATIGVGGTQIANTDGTVHADGTSTIIEYYGYFNEETQEIIKDTENIIDPINNTVEGGIGASEITAGRGGAGGGFGGNNLNVGNNGSSDGFDGPVTLTTFSGVGGPSGQRKSSYPFNNKNEMCYCAGGGSAGKYIYGFGGKANGSNGGNSIEINGQDGLPNTGNGGGGSYNDGIPGNGGSGLIIIRPTINDFPLNSFSYEPDDPTNEDPAWCYDQYGIRILRSGTLTILKEEENNRTLSTDIYLLGGGGSGGNYGSKGGGGGGSGYVTHASDIKLISDHIYKITIGAGGAAKTSASAVDGLNGTATSIIEEGVKDTTISLTADGGKGGNDEGDGGAGGSGGGAGNAAGEIGSQGGVNGGSAKKISSTYVGGKGAGISTLPFNDINNTEMLATGGSGSRAASAGGGAGAGFGRTTTTIADALPNTGCGGGGNLAGLTSNTTKNQKRTGAGGSGVVIIKLHE